MDSDLVFDMRYLPNPFYLKELRELSGLDAPVKEFVFSHAQAVEFMHHLENMVAFLLPLYIEEGKPSLTISIGCTGGKHRSVAIAQALVERTAAHGYQVETIHRDLEKGLHGSG